MLGQQGAEEIHDLPRGENGQEGTQRGAGPRVDVAAGEGNGGAARAVEGCTVQDVGRVGCRTPGGTRGANGASSRCDGVARRHGEAGKRDEPPGLWELDVVNAVQPGPGQVPCSPYRNR